MPRNDTLTIPPNTWTEVTVNDITTFSLQVRRGDCHIKGTVGSVAPTDFNGAFFLHNREEFAFLNNANLQNMFGGAGLVTRLFVHSSEGATITINHG